jgi:CheY-like chemotaxis protein
VISILYVDDEPDLLSIGKIFLERGGQFSVATLTSAPAALEALKNTTYDAIISDYQMPVMNGIDFLKQVRASGNTIPFIIFTGRGREEIVIQALNEGADFYLQKGGEPVSQFTELEHKIRQAVQQRLAEASIRDLLRREADIINFLPDATFAIDTNGVVIAWNQAMEKMTGVRSAGIIGLLFVLVDESFFLFRGRTGNAADQIKHSRQEETEEEKGEKQFRFAVYEKEKTQSKNDYDNRMVLSKGNNAVHES